MGSIYKTLCLRMQFLPLILCLVVGSLGGEDLLFLGPGFGSFLKSDLIDFWSEDPIDCDIPHYPLFNGDPELNQIQGLEGAIINDRVTLCGGGTLGQINQTIHTIATPQMIVTTLT